MPREFGPDIHSGFLARLLHDRAGNTIAIVAASLAPILAMAGGGIDMGRSYLSQSRLQQACDAGVLAARKKLGSQVVISGEVPVEVAAAGNRFFNANFRDGSYGTENRDFQMTLNADYSISGTAQVVVPTTIMRMFGFNEVPVEVHCQARLNFSNTDIMMVLDTTGSMGQTNKGDSKPKIQVLRDTVKAFYAQLEGSKTPGTRIRYGFVPYSANVNVGYLLKSGWMVDEWTYNGRKAIDSGQTQTVTTYNTTYSNITGSATAITPYLSSTCPKSTATWKDSNLLTLLLGILTGTTTVKGTSYTCTPGDGGLLVTGTIYNTFQYDWKKTPIGTTQKAIYKWHYSQMPFDVSFMKGASDDSPYVGGSLSVQMVGYPTPSPDWMTATFQGCIEERDTYEITDFGNVDFSKALDLDIDLVPQPGNPATQWRPMLHEISFEPEVSNNGSGGFKTPSTTSNDYLQASAVGATACPAKSQKLQEMTSDELNSYLDSLVPAGNTYHDIGMIWGGRLLSPTGIFAEENADAPGAPTSRHLIFLTDGETAPLDLTYGTYGIEPLDKRRWSQKSKQTLTQVVEDRFTVACDEVKKRNITVWLIGFGTQLNPVMTECAGPGHYFEATNAAELNSIFSKIASAMGDLRITQ